MFADPPAFRRFFRYVRWADLAQLEASKSLSDEAYFRDHGWSFGSVHRLLLHLIAAQDAWLDRFEGRPVAWKMDDPALAARAAVEPAWRALHDRFARFLDGLSPESLARTIHFTTRAGQPYAGPLAELLTQVMTHAGTHRGQLNSMIKLSGGTPPTVDYMIWYFSVEKRPDTGV